MCGQHGGCLPDRRVHRDEGNPSAGLSGGDPFGKLAAVHVGEQHVGENELVKSRVLEQHLQCLPPVSGGAGLVSQRAHQPAGGGARRGAAFDDKHDRRAKERQREWVGREHSGSGAEVSRPGTLSTTRGWSSCRLFR
jgi:hypothetical protein